MFSVEKLGNTDREDKKNVYHSYTQTQCQDIQSLNILGYILLALKNKTVCIFAIYVWI